MSDREWQILVQDILEAIEKISRYTADMAFELFEADPRTIDAVIRNLIVIGEAAVHMPKEIVSTYPAVPWRLMGDMRNFAVHHYWGVDAAVLWQTIQEDLPPLVVQLRQIVSAEKNLT